MMTDTPLKTDAAASHPSKSMARHLPAVGRVLLGLLLFVPGLNGFLNFLPPPSTPIPEGAAAFAGALLNTGYMFPLIKGTEVLTGSLLLSNRFVPLALALAAPVVVNIVAFHAFLAPDGMAIPLALLALELALAWSYRTVYRPMLGLRVRPG